MQGTFFRGTTHNQDARFSDKEKKLMKTMSFDEILDKKIDLKKVDLGVLEPWVEQQVTKILGMEDEVIQAMIINELETYKKDDKSPNGKLIQIRVTGFLERDANKFMVDLWKLLLEGQDSPHGIPLSLIDSKKVELKAREEELRKTGDQLKRLEEAKQKLKEDQDKLKQISRLFTDRESSPEVKQSTQFIAEPRKETQKKEVQERRHKELFKKYEEDEYLENQPKKDHKDEQKDKKDEQKDNQSKRRNRSSSRSRSGSRHHKKDSKKSNKDRRHRDDSYDRRDRNRKHHDRSSKSHRDRSRS